jgi:hypothetical protein
MTSTTQSGSFGVPRAGSGWIRFAVVMLAVAGSFNVIDGIVALTRSRFYVAGATYVFSDLRTWGWIVLVLGVLQLFAAFTVIGGSEAGRWAGIGAAVLNAIGQLLFLNAYPLWSIAAFAMDVLIVYALSVYGGSRLRSDA